MTPHLANVPTLDTDRLTLRAPQIINGDTYAELSNVAASGVHT